MQSRPCPCFARCAVSCDRTAMRLLARWYTHTQSRRRCRAMCESGYTDHIAARYGGALATPPYDGVPKLLSQSKSYKMHVRRL